MVTNPHKPFKSYALFEVKYFCNHHVHACCLMRASVSPKMTNPTKFDFNVMESNQIKSNEIPPLNLAIFDFKTLTLNAQVPMKPFLFKILLWVFKRWLLTFNLLPSYLYWLPFNLMIYPWDFKFSTLSSREPAPTNAPVNHSVHRMSVMLYLASIPPSHLGTLLTYILALPTN